MDLPLYPTNLSTASAHDTRNYTGLLAIISLSFVGIRREATVCKHVRPYVNFTYLQTYYFCGSILAPNMHYTRKTQFLKLLRITFAINVI
jgi:hypothetical protein